MSVFFLRMCSESPIVNFLDWADNEPDDHDNEKLYMLVDKDKGYRWANRQFGEKHPSICQLGKSFESRDIGMTPRAYVDHLIPAYITDLLYSY